MSWDVVLFKVPEGVTSIEDLPQNHKPDPLGSHAEVERALPAALPAVDLSDPNWGSLEGATWSIELNIGRDDPVDSVMLHVRGSGDDVMTTIFTIATVLGCRVLDCSTGDLIGQEDTTSWHEFQAFRDSAPWARGTSSEAQ